VFACCNCRGAGAALAVISGQDDASRRLSRSRSPANLSSCYGNRGQLRHLFPDR
jgi:hypothetical protein